jgi:hypothetical protein
MTTTAKAMTRETFSQVTLSRQATGDRRRVGGDVSYCSVEGNPNTLCRRL